MKFSIEFHEWRLKNSKLFLSQSKKELKGHARRVCYHQNMVKFYELQIKRAKQMKKDRFDEELFLKKERKNYV